MWTYIVVGGTSLGTWVGATGLVSQSTRTALPMLKLKIVMSPNGVLNPALASIEA